MWYSNLCSSKQKDFITTTMKHNPVLLNISLNHTAAYHPNNNEFPQKENKFLKYFLVHEPSTHPSLQKQVTVGCIVHTSKTIKDI